MKKYNYDIDSDFIDVEKSSGIKEKIPIIILIFILLVIGSVFGLFIYNKIMNYSYVKSHEVNSINNKKKNNENIKVKPVNKDNSNTNVKTIDVKKEYYCPDSYTLDGTKCILTSTIKATASYSCSSGELVGNTCIIVEKEYVPSEGACFNYKNEEVECTLYTTPGLKCPSGYTIDISSGGLRCVKETITNINATINYECPSEYTLSGSDCVKKISIDAPYNYVCDDGYELSGSKCSKR